MGDRGGGSGGRFHGRRGNFSGRNPPSGNPQGGRVNNTNNKPFVWKRDGTDGGSKNSGEDERDLERRERDRRQSGNMQNSGDQFIVPRSGQSSGATKANPRAPSPGNTEPCFNCNVAGHYAASCPTIRCDRCKKLGHIRELCQAVLPWECVANMCGFQTPGRGFFYFPDACAGKQTKERTSSVIISVLEGNPTSRDIEKELNEYFDGAWRCTARVMNPVQFLMRFPSSKEVDRTCFYGKRMEMKTFDGVINIKPWSVAAGAKAEMHKAWVKVRNIPADKRCEATAAYVGSLVGVSLEIDQSTLYKPEFCRILIGCRDIKNLPDSAEGVLGDYFYDFYYEIDSVVVGEQPKQKMNITVDSHTASSPKRTRHDQSSSVNPSESSTGFASENSQTDYRGTDGGSNYRHNLDALSEHESEEESDDDPELLIEKIARERQDGAKISMTVQNSAVMEIVSYVGKPVDVAVVEKLPEKDDVVEDVPISSSDQNQCKVMSPSKSVSPVVDVSSSVQQKNTCITLAPWAPITPVVQQESPLVDTEKRVLQSDDWPPLISVTEVEVEGESPVDASKYRVQTPDSVSPMNVDGGQSCVDDEQEVPRNQAKKMQSVVEQAVNISKKRNLEGLYKDNEKEAIRSGAEQLALRVREIARRDRPSQNDKVLMLTNG